MNQENPLGSERMLTAILLGHIQGTYISFQAHTLFFLNFMFVLQSLHTEMLFEQCKL